jgi:Icc-related predicted phosphoesterase
MNKTISVIGDCHGKYNSYHKIISQAEYTVQLGDFGFKYDTLKNVDYTKHVIIGGNHDNYDICNNYPHFLSDYGYMVDFNGIDFFYYRGAYSIDRQYRTIGIDWWEKEQVDIESFMKARELYKSIKPDIVLTHDCPEFLVLEYIRPSGVVYQNITNWALGELYNAHQPKIWLHGHHHISKTTIIGNTKFTCLNELEVYNLSA